MEPSLENSMLSSSTGTIVLSNPVAKLEILYKGEELSVEVGSCDIREQLLAWAESDTSGSAVVHGDSQPLNVLHSTSGLEGLEGETPVLQNIGKGPLIPQQQKPAPSTRKRPNFGGDQPGEKRLKQLSPSAPIPVVKPKQAHMSELVGVAARRRVALNHLRERREKMRVPVQHTLSTQAPPKGPNTSPKNPSSSANGPVQPHTPIPTREDAHLAAPAETDPPAKTSTTNPTQLFSNYHTASTSPGSLSAQPAPTAQIANPHSLSTPFATPGRRPTPTLHARYQILTSTGDWQTWPSGYLTDHTAEAFAGCVASAYGFDTAASLNVIAFGIVELQASIHMGANDAAAYERAKEQIRELLKACSAANGGVSGSVDVRISVWPCPIVVI
jgi:hypothetical protein